MLRHRPGWRKQLYAVIPATTAVLQTYGILTQEQASVWAGLAIALWGLWMAWANTDHTRKPRNTTHIPPHQ
ncbi:phage holin [Rothia mucilaginosa]|uniref:phage holin n=1 Tax=Rothia mucilaginosa TaxID=43675 RepID=UPI003F65FD3B